MPTPFVAEFVLPRQFRHSFSVQKVNENVGESAQADTGPSSAVVSLQRPLRGPRTELLKLTVNTKTPFETLIAHNIIYIEIHVSANEF